ncbi:MAG: DNRLRE domain-containing protein [Bacteroidia bacterium]
MTNSDESVLQRALDPWSEATMNWNVQPSVSTLNQVILPASTSPTQDYTNMDVTAMVQTMVDSGNYGFSLRLVNEAPYARLIFASGDHPDSLQHPRLVITYTPPLTCFNQRLAPDGEDATFDDYHPAQNNPNEIEYFCGGWTINATFVRWRNVFKFDLSSIPPNATVQNAALSLYFPVHTNFTGANDTSLTSSDECILQRVVTPWTETTVTWNNQPTPDPTNAVHIGPSTSGYQNFPSIDVTAMVQDMINDPANSYGFMLTQLVEQQYGRMLFASGDSPDDSLRPFLEVCYFTTIGVDEINNESDVALWPNPASGHFNLQWNNEADITAVNVFDSMGKLIRNIPKVNSNILQIDATDWAAGLYFVKLTGKGSVLFRRMMKE